MLFLDNIFSNRVSGFLFAAGVISAGLGFAACQTIGSSDSTPAAAVTQEFTAAGCSFAVAPRAEYTDWSAGKTDVGATPNIRRVRLGLGGNVTPSSAGHADPSTSIGIAWQTDDGTNVSEVEWGTGPDPTSWPKTNTTSGVSWLTPQGSSGLPDERMHEAYVCGLTPGTTYYYRVGGGPTGKEVWSSDVYSFTTTPSATTPITIALTGDSRGEQKNAWQILQQKLLTLSPTVQLFSGDMIFLYSDQSEWEEWLDKAWKGADGKPSALGQLLTLAAHGNHDNHSSLFFGNLTLPQEPKTFSQYAELFYSVDVGPAHIIMMDDAWIAVPGGGDPGTPPGYASVLGTWLEADLTAAEANRAKVPWIIVEHHRPEYSSSTHGMDSDVLATRAFFAPIWEKHHVDLAIAGHDHDYERSKPLTGPTSMPTVHMSAADGTTYLVCAGSGADAYTASTSTFTETSHDFTNGGALGLYALLKISTTSLAIEAHELHADGTDPVFDTATLSK